jgi:hypothetical protein
MVLVVIGIILIATGIRGQVGSAIGAIITPLDLMPTG